MARNGSGVYSLPAGSTATDGNTAEASQHNTPLLDIANDLNVARPVVAGGTGATTASAARTSLGLGSIATQAANLVDIGGGEIDGTPIGANSASTGAFTTLSASGDVALDTNTLFVDASENKVGLGTTSPDERLHLVGDALVEGGSPALLFYENDVTADNGRWKYQVADEQLTIQALTDAGSGGGAIWQFNRTANNIDKLTGLRGGVERIRLSNWDSEVVFSNADGTIGTEDANSLLVKTNDVERMRVASTGELLIGVSSAGGSPVRVSGLPTSSAGLSSGDVWNDSGALKIV